MRNHGSRSCDTNRIHLRQRAMDLWSTNTHYSSTSTPATNSACLRATFAQFSATGRMIMRPRHDCSRLQHHCMTKVTTTLLPSNTCLDLDFGYSCQLLQYDNLGGLPLRQVAASIVSLDLLVGRMRRTRADKSSNISAP